LATAVVMGVAASGKSTVGRALAARLGWSFLDADDFHPPANVEKMSKGVPLTDADRWPWLDRLAGELAGRTRAGGSVVLACSALKWAYRERLRAGVPGPFEVIYLRLTRGQAVARAAGRGGHFMPASLVESQFEALEEPGGGEAIVVDAAEPVDVVVERVAARLAPGSADQPG